MSYEGFNVSIFIQIFSLLNNQIVINCAQNVESVCHAYKLSYHFKLHQNSPMCIREYCNFFYPFIAAFHY